MTLDDDNFGVGWPLCDYKCTYVRTYTLYSFFFYGCMASANRTSICPCVHVRVFLFSLVLNSCVWAYWYFPPNFPYLAQKWLTHSLTHSLTGYKAWRSIGQTLPPPKKALPVAAAAAPTPSRAIPARGARAPRGSAAPSGSRLSAQIAIWKLFQIISDSISKLNFLQLDYLSLCIFRKILQNAD